MRHDEKVIDWKGARKTSLERRSKTINSRSLHYLSDHFTFHVIKKKVINHFHFSSYLFYYYLHDLYPMTMSVLKGQFSFPLTSYTKERKESISRAHGENRENRTELSTGHFFATCPVHIPTCPDRKIYH